MGKNTHVLKICSAAALWLAASAAWAQSADNKPEGDGAALSGAILPKISVTATRNPIDAFEFPGMVNVVGPRKAEEIQPSTLDDLLRHIPGVDFSGGPRRTGEVPSIRGFSGNDIVILLDGARQNFNAGHNGRFFVDPWFLRQIEVVKGSSSALYGNGGTGGVIELRTVEAGDFLTGNETAGFQTNFGFQDANQEWSTGVLGFGRPASNLSLIAGATFRTSDDIRLGDGNDRQSQDNILSGLFKAQLTPRDDHAVEFSWQRFFDDATEPANGQSATATDKSDKEILTDNFRLSYGYNPASPLIDLKLLAYYTDSEVQETNLAFSSTKTIGQVDTQSTRTVGFKADNRSRFIFNDDAFLIATYGLDSYRDRNEGDSDGQSRAGIPGATSSVSGAFAQGQFEFEDVFGTLASVSMIPGLRFDFYTSSSDDSTEDTSEGQLSPKFALQVRPVEPLMLFGSYGRAFRAPTPGELFPTGTHFTFGPNTNSFLSNPGLQPQTADTFEIGGGLRFNDVISRNDQFQLKGAKYWTRAKDFIDFRVLTFTSQFVNVENARLYGHEIEASYENSRLLFEVGYESITGENEDTEAPLGVLTPDKFTFHSAIKFPEIASRVGWRFTLADNFSDTNTASQIRGGYQVSDIYATWQAKKDSVLKGFGITVGVDNMFDRKYERTAKDSFETGRNYKASLQYTQKW